MVLDFGAIMRVLRLQRNTSIFGNGKYIHIAITKEDVDITKIMDMLEQVINKLT